MKKKLETRLKRIESDLKEVKGLLNKEQKPADGFRLNDTEETDWMPYFENGIIKFGINGYGEWFRKNITDSKVLLEECVESRLTTESEVTERLTKFVKSKYKEGDTVSRLHKHNFGLFGRENPFKLDSKSFNEVGFWDNRIWMGNLLIWDTNEGWAKIVQKPKYAVVPNQLGIEDRDIFSDYTVLKDGKILSYDEWVSQAKRIADFLNFES